MPACAESPRAACASVLRAALHSALDHTLVARESPCTGGGLAHGCVKNLFVSSKAQDRDTQQTASLFIRMEAALPPKLSNCRLRHGTATPTWSPQQGLVPDRRLVQGELLCLPWRPKHTQEARKEETATPLFRDLLLSAGRHFSVLMIRLSGRRPLHHGPFRVHQSAQMASRHAFSKEAKLCPGTAVAVGRRGPSVEPGTLLQVN